MERYKFLNFSTMYLNEEKKGYGTVWKLYGRW